MSLVFTGTRADVFPHGMVHVILEAGQLKLADPTWPCLYIVSGHFLGKREPVNSSHRDHLNLKTKSISHLALLMIILSPSTLTFLDLHFGLLDF